MSNLQKFIDVVSNDEELFESFMQLQDLQDEEAIIAFAAERGITLLKADLVKNEEPVELTDDELEQTAGGVFILGTPLKTTKLPGKAKQELITKKMSTTYKI